MSYTKTNWVNNTTPINETNLNKIEQGIYDNSLVVDAVTNTLNPTDTETYKTAELTEGQITDVIGVNDIIIKGQTEQDGTPTPSAPVDVNVVSGSNVVNTSNKNLFDGILENSGFQETGLNAEGNTKRIRIRSKNYTRVKENQTYTINITEYNTTKGTISINISYYNKNDYSTARLSESGWKNLPYTFITPENCKFIRFLCKITSSSGDSEIIYTDVNKAQLEQNSTATTYQPHQGKELPLDLPVENLFDKDNIEKYTGFTNGSDYNKVAYNTAIKSIIIPCKENTTYTVSKINGGNYDRFNIASFTTKPTTGTIASKYVGDNSLTSLTITTGPNDTYIMVLYYHTSETVYSENDILDSIQIEQGSKANAYTPFGTDPIELCKIGDYQDYFYKSGSKWYLHKEIEKKVLDGSENWGFSGNIDNNISYQLVIGETQDYSSIDIYFAGLNSSFIYSELSLYKVTDPSLTGLFTILQTGKNKIVLRIVNKDVTTVADLKTWFSNNPTSVYYVLKEPTNTEITDTTLISQLEAIYNAPLYEQTNITQENNDLPMVLDITACKDNINGIKAFIRK